MPSVIRIGFGGFLACTLVLSFSLQASQLSFREAKKELREIYAKEIEPLSIYCGCKISFKGKKLVPDLKACDYQIRKQARRAKRIEWEHVVPVWEFGHQRQCWQVGGRKNCARNDAEYIAFAGDMHNLFPSVGEINADRSNYRFGMVTYSNYAAYGGCKMKIDFKRRIAEPPERARGTIARVYLYMEQKYGLKISGKQRSLFEAWNKTFPPSDSECRKHEKVVRKQGDINSFISDQCKKKFSETI